MSLPPTDKPFPAKANNSSKARRLERWQSKYFALLRRPTVGVGVEGLGGVFLRLLLFLGTKIKDSGLDRDTWGLNFEVDSIQLQIISVRLVKNFW